MMGAEEKTTKKTVSEILIDRFLKDVDKKGSLPWQRPYECYNAFNWLSKQPYRGFNRLLLPFGEYLTANQLNQYNKEHNEDFRFQKGIEWYPIYFFKKESRPTTFKETSEALEDVDITAKTGYLGYAKGYAWYFNEKENKYIKERNILRYYDVADIHWFKNSKGETLPSRLESGEVVITKSKPQEVYKSYIERSGIKVEEDYTGIPCYIPSMDMVRLNPHTKNEDTWFSTAFHELGHSTGAKSRLNRKGVTYEGLTEEEKKSKSVYAVEECIAEITAYLCCAECGVYDFETSSASEYENNLAYVNGWKSRIKDFGKEFLYICSQADKAFNYIMGEEI